MKNPKQSAHVTSETGIFDPLFTPIMKPKNPSSNPAILTGMKPGQSFEEFKANTISAMRGLGFLRIRKTAPKRPHRPLPQMS